MNSLKKCFQLYNKVALFHCRRANASNYKRPNQLHFHSDHFEHLKTILSRNTPPSTTEWAEVRSTILSADRQITEVNIDATIIGHCLPNAHLEVAKSYIEFLKHINITPNLSTLGRLLRLYYNKSTKQVLTTKDEKDIIELCANLLEKYPILDSITAENFVHALSTTMDWKRCLELLEMIKITAIPSGSCYGAVAIAAFSNGNCEIGWRILEEMAHFDKVPQCPVFLTVLKYDRGGVERLLSYIGLNEILISERVALEILNASTGSSRKTSLRNRSSCKNCKSILQRSSISVPEFNELSKSFLQKTLIRKDVFLKSTPSEVIDFESFVTRTAPYDVVIDGLNVAFSAGTKQPPIVFARMLATIVKHFSQQSKKILILGRRHMNGWPKDPMDFVRRNATLFLAQNLSQDDPFLLYATLKSGPKADFVSRDLMRSHAFLLGSELRPVFRRWQRQHQFSLIYASANGKVRLKEPIGIQISAHKVNGKWHIPFAPNVAFCTQLDPFEVPIDWICVQLNEK